MSETHTPGSQKVHVWRSCPGLRLLIAGQGAVRMIVRVNEQDVRFGRVESRAKDAEDNKDKGAFHEVG